MCFFGYFKNLNEVNENDKIKDENKEEENENIISIDCSENFSMIIESFTEIDDCSFSG